ncbi:MAG: hypothetical protein G01um101466_640 [Parcubacteria group bacterium Gr01-1014_66]|nr:MAG: hypothetical protein G01um101466_640 [Parcubacteria group bacterium Gr01-1014_66]
MHIFSFMVCYKIAIIVHFVPTDTEECEDVFLDTLENTSNHFAYGDYFLCRMLGLFGCGGVV